MNAAAQPQAAAERLFLDDIEATSFLAGVDRGWWRLHDVTWPFAVIEVAATPRIGAPQWFAFRFNLAGYPQAPSAQPWDIAAGAPLAPALWPAGNDRISRIFNPGWRTDALYLPMDRLALEGHDVWLSQHACHLWDPAKDITQYLRLLHELLNEEGYTGVRG